MDSLKKKSGFVIHEDARVHSPNIGSGTRIWQFTVILEGASIGRDNNICSHCFIENDVVLGDRVTIKNGVYIWNGVRLEDDVFVGANVNFTNDKYPKSRNAEAELQRTVVKRGASIGAGATILPGIVIGEGATVGAGALVTKDVNAGETVYGNPAVSAPARLESLPWSRLSFTKHRDERGCLVAIDDEIPFEVRRVYCLFGTAPRAVRGKHAHIKLQQIVIASSGSFKLKLHDGFKEQVLELKSPSEGLFIGPAVWRELFDFSEDAVCTVLASRPYEPDDYINSFDEFLTWRGAV